MISAAAINSTPQSSPKAVQVSKEELGAGMTGVVQLPTPLLTHVCNLGESLGPKFYKMGIIIAIKQ